MWHRVSAGLLAGLMIIVFSVPASALNITYVSSLSTSNAGGCDKNTPCTSFRAAYDQTNTGGEIVCLTPGSYGTVTIMKSISINCIPSTGGLTSAGFDSATVKIDIAPSQADPLRTVRLRGVSLRGIDYTGTSYTRLGLRGIEIVAAAAVYIENSVITEFADHGIYDHRTGGQTKLFVKDTIISDNGGPGIVASSGAPGVMFLDNISVLNNLYGVAAASGNNVSLKNSAISGNTQAGVLADGGAQIIVENTTISNNNIGVLVGGTIRLSDSRIQFNNQAVSGAAISLGGNKFSGNGSIGATPPLASGASGDVYN